MNNIRSRERSRSRSSSRERYSSRYRSKSPVHSKKISNSKVQKEYIFPIGIHQDIDQSIIEKMDFEAIVNLLKIAPKLRMVIYKNINNIIKNSIDYTDDELVNCLYELLILKEFTILNSFDKSDDLIKKLRNTLDTDIDHNRDEIIAYVSILNENQTIIFTEWLLPSFENETEYLYFEIEYMNKILDLALEIKNITMVNTIKDRFKKYNLSQLKNELERLNNNLNLS